MHTKFLSGNVYRRSHFVGVDGRITLKGILKIQEEKV
jgi:hypothetical protein